MLSIPEISIVIPSLGRQRYLVDALSDLSNMKDVSSECLIVLQRYPTSDELNELARSYNGPLRIFFLAQPNASLARNIGLYHAQAPITLFLDDDIRVPNDNFLFNHLKNYEDDSLSGVYGQVLEVGQESIDQPDPKCISTDSGWYLLRANYSVRCRTRNGASNNLSVRTDWARKVGGMDSWFVRGARREETEFNLRLTKLFGPFVFDPTAGLVHLSAEGGSRSWGKMRGTVPMHHIFGHCYFLLRSIYDRTIGFRELQNELRYLFTALLKIPQRGFPYYYFPVNLGRMGYGFVLAIRALIIGPQRIDSLIDSDFELLGEWRTFENMSHEI